MRNRTLKLAAMGFCGLPLGVIFLIALFQVLYLPGLKPAPAPAFVMARPLPQPPALADRHRHDIWNDYCLREAALEKQVDKKYPLLTESPNPGKEQRLYLVRIGRRNQYEEDLQEAYRPAFMKHWKITDHDLTAIEVEGIDKHWAGPEPIGPHSERFPE